MALQLDFLFFFPSAVSAVHPIVQRMFSSFPVGALAIGLQTVQSMLYTCILYDIL